MRSDRPMCYSDGIGQELEGFMMRFLFVLLTSLGATAHGATISFSGPNFDEIGGSYSASQRVQGQLTTSGPLPGGVAVDIAGQIVAYSFTDGVQTLTQDNSQVVVALVATDTGAVIGISLTIWSEERISAKGEGGRNISGIDIRQGGEETFSAGYQGAPCQSIQACGGFSIDNSINYGIANAVGSLQGSAIAVRVPVNNPVALAILILTIAVGAGLAVRRRRANL